MVKDLVEVFASDRTTAVSFAGASVAQVIKMMELHDEDELSTLIIGTKDISNVTFTPETSWGPFIVCLLKDKKKPRLVVLCTVSLSSDVETPVADFMKGNVARLNEMLSNLVRRYPEEI